MLSSRRRRIRFRISCSLYHWSRKMTHHNPASKPPKKPSTMCSCSKISPPGFANTLHLRKPCANSHCSQKNSSKCPNKLKRSTLYGLINWRMSGSIGGTMRGRRVGSKTPTQATKRKSAICKVTRRLLQWFRIMLIDIILGLPTRYWFLMCWFMAWKSRGGFMAYFWRCCKSQTAKNSYSWPTKNSTLTDFARSTTIGGHLHLKTFPKICHLMLFVISGRIRCRGSRIFRLDCRRCSRIS